MSEFLTYLKIGVQHILDINGLDHLLFIISFCLLYSLKELREIVLLITAFTIGHSITLILAGFSIVTVNSKLIELLIPITILISCIKNFIGFAKGSQTKVSLSIHYFIILFFGLIHGLGFSNFIKSLLFEGENYIIPILGFNIGIELAQLVVVTIFYMLLFAICKIWDNLKWFKVIVNTTIILITLYLISKLEIFH